MGYADPNEQRKAVKRGVNKLRKARRELIRAMKEVPCHDCGVTYPYFVMDFDHRPDEIKLDNVARMLAAGATWQKIEAEIAKCDVVCANCHRMRTHSRMEVQSLVR